MGPCRRLHAPVALLLLYSSLGERHGGSRFYDSPLDRLYRRHVVKTRGSLALDIGGTLTKALFVDSSPSQEALDEAVKFTKSIGGSMDSETDPSGRRRTYVGLSLKVPALNSTLHFFSFETRYIEDCIEFVRNYAGDRHRKKLVVRATGGGAFKFAKRFQDDVGVSLDRRDEMACLVNGITFLMNHIPKEVFSVSSKMRSPIASPGEGLDFVKNYRQTDPDPFPYLLVNIGSGVSVLAVRGPGKEGFRRISGSSLGGSTFLGLACLLTGVTTFDEALELTRKGDVCKVDMLVGDLYSGDYGAMGLNADVIAASFGKVVMQRPAEEAAAAVAAALDPCIGEKGELETAGADPSLTAPDPFELPFQREDVALSLLRMVSNNIGQIAYLNARNSGIRKVVFGGSFLRGNPYTMASISAAVEFWSRGEMEALFVDHEGFAGALGAFLCDTPYKLGMDGSIFARDD